ncbi:helix-turn-helix domain-containing protein [Flavobacterium galactosidilyticum]|uniref:helix-turn-helix domain-containing protein n=1 Tax=Flavobacterium galactosidilyticum TaxID=2893886 RepID=UPI001E47F1BD|nr:helix-turn-helix transcriptional regulator [Flavobacterium sp. F-340]UFH46651.1 helix-turn-helix domain-containing protein [Flavobacterium sp. F-340]
MEEKELNRVQIALGATIRRIREETTDFSQSKLSIEVGMSENQIRRIERGESNPTVKTLTKIAKALKVDIKILFE